MLKSGLRGKPPQRRHALETLHVCAEFSRSLANLPAAVIAAGSACSALGIRSGVVLKTPCDAEADRGSADGDEPILWQQVQVASSFVQALCL